MVLTSAIPGIYSLLARLSQGLLGSLALLPVLLQPGVLDPLLVLIDRALGGMANPAAAAIVLGAIWIVLGQLVGFLICWVGWHVTKQ